MALLRTCSSRPGLRVRTRAAAPIPTSRSGSVPRARPAGRPGAALAFGAVALAALSLAGCSGRGGPSGGEAVTRAEDAPRLRPPIHDVTIPPNLCPLTFTVQEPGTAYRVRFEAPAGASLETAGKDPRVTVSARSWRKLLAGAAGSDLRVLVSVRDAAGAWRAFAPVFLHVSTDPVDGYLAYRRILPLYNFWYDVAVYQRALTGWREDVVLHGRGFAHGCTNCHSFANAGPGLMSIGIRSQDYGSGTLVCRDGRVSKLGTRWAYTSWHPSGRAAAFSLNKVHQFFHSVGVEVRDVCDLDSDVAVYYPDGNRVVAGPAVAAPEYLETYPAWSADGRELYFCRAPITWQDRAQVPPPGYYRLRYSLVKASFDLESGQFGDPQVVIDAEAVGKSVLLPRPSPDGRFVLFCLCDYGCFPIYQPSSDLYLLDLASGSHRRLELNSELSESWHSWSSNGRWFAFSSKREDGLFTRVYLAHVDTEGTVGKPFVLPQEDPGYYDGCLETFTVPEFLTGPIRVSPRALAAAVRSRRVVKTEMPAMSMTAPAAGGAVPLHPGDWSEAPVPAHE